MTILHVDDDPSFLKIAKQCLEMQGEFQVETASSVEEAIERMKKEDFTAIVSDFVMPGKDGLEFLHELRTKGNRTPFIIFTGKGREEVAVKTLSQGADGYFSKLGESETVYGELAHGIRQVVEKKTAERKTWEREERLKAVFSSSPDAITVSDLHGNILDCNEAARKMFGFSSKEEVIGKSSFDFIAEKDRQKAYANLKKTLEQGTVRNSEYALSNKDGEEFRGELSASILKDSLDNPLGFVGVIRDITERKRSEAEVKRLASFPEKNPNPVLEIDLTGKMTYLNPAARKLLSQLQSSKLSDGFEEDLKAIIGKFNTHRTAAFERENVKIGNRHYKQSVHQVPENAALRIYMVDTTERSRVKKTLQESEEKYRRLVEHLQEGVWTIDKDSCTTFANPRMAKMLGYTVEEMLGKPLFAFMDEGGIEIAKRLLERRAQGIREQHDFEFVKKDGSRIYATVETSPINDSNGNYIGALAGVVDITERKKAEQALKESEEKYRSLVELAPDGIVAVNTEGIITSANRSFLTLVGYDSEEEIVGKSFTELMTMRNEDIPRFQGVFMSLMKGESPSLAEFLYVRRDGTSRWAEVHPSLMTKDGNPVGVQAIMRDATERKNAEEALRETKDYLDNLLNYANAPIIVWDNKQKITLFNNAFESLTGYTKESVLGRNIDALFPPLQKTEILQTIEGATRGEKWRSVEVPILCKDEETRIALWNSANVTDKDGKIVATIAQGQDITERKALDGALKDAKQKWTSLTENTDDIIMIVNSEGIIQYINRTIPPHTPEETIGKPVYEYVPREQHDTMRSSIEKTFETGVPLDYVVSSNIPKIGTIWFRTKIVPVKDEEKTVSAILISTDITELKNTEERLRETNTRLAVTNEKLHVVGGLTRHDVRNKLSAVTGNAYLLRRKLTEDQKALEQLNDMEVAVRLVEKIFEFARIYEKLGTEQLVNLDVGKAVDGAVSLFSDLKGVKIVNECGGLTVLADSLLSQVFYNLIDNSLKYGEKIQQIRVYFKTSSSNWLELVYEDDGVGISSDMRDNLFKEGVGKGTGYGLFMIKRICEVYGWNIQETGIQGKGVKFVITIPKTDPSGKENYLLQGER